jgi:hypothetical protein
VPVRDAHSANPLYLSPTAVSPYYDASAPMSLYALPPASPEYTQLPGASYSIGHETGAGPAQNYTAARASFYSLGSSDAPIPYAPGSDYAPNPSFYALGRSDAEYAPAPSFYALGNSDVPAPSFYALGGADTQGGSDDHAYAGAYAMPTYAVAASAYETSASLHGPASGYEAPGSLHGPATGYEAPSSLYEPAAEYQHVGDYQGGVYAVPSMAASSPYATLPDHDASSGYVAPAPYALPQSVSGEEAGVLSIGGAPRFSAIA